MTPQILTALLSLTIGLSLGLLGGGGAILALPILVYVAGYPPAVAVGMSLAIVGATSAVAGLAHLRAGRVSGAVALGFGGAGLAGAFAGAQLTHLVPGRLLMLAFGLLAAAVAGWMLLGRRVEERAPAGAAWRGAAAGVGVGVLTGFLGVGGGFLIVPALLGLAGLTMKRAVGTSLVVIAMNSAAGLAAHLVRGGLPLGPTALLAGLAAVGALAGVAISGRIPSEHLRRAFAVFVLAVGVAVAGRSLLAHPPDRGDTGIAKSPAAAQSSAHRRLRPWPR